MFDKLDLNNFKIRTKLIGVLALPIIALLLFAVIGYGQRSTTAKQAKTDANIVAAADATSTLVAAMQREAVASIIQVATKKENADIEKLQHATDQAYTAFKDANGKLDLSGSSGVSSEASTALSTLDPTFAGFKTNRSQLASLTSQTTATDWSDLLDTYLNSSIGPFVTYVQTLATLTTTPDVVVPLEQLSALLSYNVQTMGLATMTVATRDRGESVWTADASATTDAPPANQELVYQAAVTQDRANAVLTSLIPGASPTKSYFTQKVQRAQNLDTVLSVNWNVPDALSGTAFNTAESQMAFPTSVVTQDDVQQYVSQLSGAASDLTSRTAGNVESARNDAVRSSRLYLLGGGLVIAIAIAGAIWISRSITQRLVKLTGAADRLSHEQLPRLVDSLKNPADDDVGYLTSSFSEIDVTGTDEIGQLAGAFNRIQGVAVDVATEQAQLLRKGIGDMFVNLARRNQSLLDRQIEFIDQLESAEEDPDQLENLFRLDHLATRMRRNAESLLVLAGAEPSRRRGKPVPLADVVRAAVGEVEDFARIDMLQFDEVLVASNAALDIAHLLSELMENAANFSPPDTRVEVVGHRTKAEGYVISVTDHGIGMSPEALAEANDQLARPPLVGLALSRSLGFIVIGRLAARFGIAVRLMPSPSSGTTAMVSLPPSLITDQPRTSSEPAALDDRKQERIVPPATDDPGALADGSDRRPPPRRTKPAAPPNAARDVPAGTMPRRVVTPVVAKRSTPDGILTKPDVGPAKAPTAPAPPAAAPVEASTSGGLTKRVPRSEGGQRAVPGGDGERSATQNRRSPEEVRSMLSNYRSGMQKGRDDDATTSNTPSPDGQSSKVQPPKARTPKDGRK